MADFSTQQKRALRKLQRRQPQLCSAGVVENFVLQYVFVETLSRTLWMYYRNRNGKHKGMSHAPIPIDTLKQAISHFNLEINNKEIEFIFDSKLTTRGGKSARNLRNGLVHAWKEGDEKEVVKRAGPLFGSLNKFISGVVNAI